MTQASTKVAPGVEPPKFRKARTLLTTLIAIVLIAFGLTARVVVAGEREIKASSDALRAADAEGAIVHARAAALWYAPGAPHVRVAYGRMLAVAREAERRRLWSTALLGYRSVVMASASTRHVVAPRPDDVEEAKSAIARIEARMGERPAFEDDQPAEEVEKRVLAALAEDATPSVTWRAVLLASFVILGGGLAWVLRRGVDETGRIDPRRSFIGFAAAGFGIAGYVLALMFA